jgi:hypothetical protein
LVELERANGLTEYAVNFSIQQLAATNQLQLLNIEQYPAGDYLNFRLGIFYSSSLSYCKRYHSKMQQQKLYLPKGWIQTVL